MKKINLRSYRQKIECWFFQGSFLWQAFLKHATLKKLANLVLGQLELLTKQTRLKSRPSYLVIDPGNICNLRCPQCLTGLRLPGRKRMFLKFAEFKKIFDQLFEFAFFVILYDWGEPFLNPDIFKIISYAQKKNVGTFVSSNFTTVKEKDLDQILTSGLEHLVVSLDGASPETYSKYRRGGDFRKVLANVKKLVEKKRAQGKRTPFIRWQFLVHRFNEHEIDKAKKMGRKLGVDAVTFYTRFKPAVDYAFAFGNKKAIKQIEGWLPRKHPEYRIDYSKPFPFNGPCKQLWQGIMVNPDGGVSPCLGLYEEEYDLGNLLKEPFAKIWNNRLFRVSRAVFKKGQPKATGIVCERCTIYAKPK